MNISEMVTTDNVVVVRAARTQGGIDLVERCNQHYEWFNHICIVLGKTKDRVFDTALLMSEVHFVSNFLLTAYTNKYLSGDIYRLFSAENDEERNLIQDRTMRVLALLEIIPEEMKVEILESVDMNYQNKGISINYMINTLRTQKKYQELLTYYKKDLESYKS